MSPKKVWLCPECGHENPLDNKTFSCQSCGYIDPELSEAKAEALREAEADSHEGDPDATEAYNEHLAESEAEYQSEMEAEQDFEEEDDL